MYDKLNKITLSYTQHIPNRTQQRIIGSFSLRFCCLELEQKLSITQHVEISYLCIQEISNCCLIYKKKYIKYTVKGRTSIIIKEENQWKMKNLFNQSATVYIGREGNHEKSFCKCIAYEQKVIYQFQIAREFVHFHFHSNPLHMNYK